MTAPTLFSLMTSLSAEARQKFGERRRRLKAREGVEERLLQVAGHVWKLEYWRGKTKLDELVIE